VHHALWTEQVGGGLTSAQFAVLEALEADPEANQSRLGEAADLDKSTTAEVVARLERDAWLREDAAHAGRGRRLVLTAPAVIAFPIVATQAAAVESALLGPLTAVERPALLGSLERLGAGAGSGAASGETAPARGLSGLLRRADRRSQRIWAEEAGKRATPPQHAVLLAIASGAREEPAAGHRLDQAEVAERADLDPVNAGEVIARLRARGLVVVERETTDRRRALVALAPAGLGLLAELAPSIAAARQRLRAPLAPDEADRLVDALRALATR